MTTGNATRMINRKQILAILGLCSMLTVLLPAVVYTQDTTSWGVAGRLFGGDVVNHRPHIVQFETDYSSSLELGAYRQTTGDDYWEQALGYPVVGVSLMATRFGNAEVLGHALSLFGHLTYCFAEAGSWRFHLRAGTGLAYLDRPHDMQTNPENVAIGSHINNVIVLDMGVARRLSGRSVFLLTASAIHFSNGAFSAPNLGVNTVGLSAGMRYRVSPEGEPALRKTDAPEVDPRFRPELRLGVGWKEVQIPHGPRFPVYLAVLSLTKDITPVYRAGLGFSGAFNYRVHDFIIPNQVFTAGAGWKSVQVGLETGHELLLGRVGVQGVAGVYLYNRFLRQRRIYTRIAVKHYWLDGRLFAGVFLKAHGAVADYVDWSVGWRF